MKTTKRVLITLMFGLSVMTLMAQADIVPAGGTASGNGGTVTYTAGQIAILQTQGNDQYIIEGVQQPYEILSIGIDDFPNITLEAMVYPNPTKQSVWLRISNFTIPEYGLTAQLFDDRGRLISTTTVADLETPIDMEQLPTATYQLRVLNGKQLLKVFKVVKTHL